MAVTLLDMNLRRAELLAVRVSWAWKRKGRYALLAAWRYCPPITGFSVILGPVWVMYARYAPVGSRTWP